MAEQYLCEYCGMVKMYKPESLDKFERMCNPGQFCKCQKEEASAV